MCLFPYPNSASLKARIKGITEFYCGSCPECLQKKSRLWALRCSMQARIDSGVMVTLTYDSYKVGSTFEENEVDPTIPLSKEHCQRFIKRLRKHFKGSSLKYLITAERGKRTGRAHYHALIFGISFDDLRFYKRSKRGNVIYKSPTLDRIWKHGICTVDSVNVSAKIARYCTKYCCKDSGVDDTFMLFSRGIGDSELKRLFNGKSYWIDGREYSIPRQIWQWYIEKKHNLFGYSRYVPHYKDYDEAKKLFNSLERLERKKENDIKNIDIHKTAEQKYAEHQKILQEYSANRERVEYIHANKLIFDELHYERGFKKRDTYYHYRDNDSVYQAYLAYWKRKNSFYEASRPVALDRIALLPSGKYARYKAAAVRALLDKDRKIPFKPPRSNCKHFLRRFGCFTDDKVEDGKSFAPFSRHYRANDTKNTPTGAWWYAFFRKKHTESMLKPYDGFKFCPFI